MWSPMIFLDWPPDKGGCTMLIYYNAIMMKQGSCSIFCTGAVMSHHDSALFQKAGTTVLEQGLCPVWTSFILALGHLQSFLLPDYLLPHSSLTELPHKPSSSRASRVACRKAARNWHWELSNLKAWWRSRTHSLEPGRNKDTPRDRRGERDFLSHTPTSNDLFGD